MTSFRLRKPNRILIPFRRPVGGWVAVGRQIACVYTQDQSSFRTRILPAVSGFDLCVFCQSPFFRRQCFPFFESLLHHLQYPFGIIGIDGCQKLATGGAYVRALSRCAGSVPVVALVGQFLKEDTFRVIASLQSPYFVRRRGELLCQLDDLWIRPNGPPARDAIVSCAAQWMTVHRPEQ